MKTNIKIRETKKKCIGIGLTATVCLYVLGLGLYSCKTVKPSEVEAPSETEKVSLIEQEDQGFGFIPFYDKSKPGFNSKGVLEKMAKRSREEILKDREVFKTQASGDRFMGIENVYWISPPKRSKLYAAFEIFPKDAFGYPDWTAAVKKNIIAPIDSLGTGNIKTEIFNKSIIFNINDRMMANVRFPHDVHNYWLSCKVCHPGIFIAKKGANVFGMNDIWEGKFCGRCHGRVSFQPKGFENCIRCHRVKRQKVVF